MRPEEAIRQQLIRRMTRELGFPKGLIAVEKECSHGRRFDILCYAKAGVPLLLVECKAEPLTEKTLQQALGYNETIQAPFLCLVNDAETKTFWKQQGKMASVPFLPPYQQLVDKLCFSSKH